MPELPRRPAALVAWRLLLSMLVALGVAVPGSAGTPVPSAAGGLFQVPLPPEEDGEEGDDGDESEDEEDEEEPDTRGGLDASTEHSSGTGAPQRRQGALAPRGEPLTGLAWSCDATHEAPRYDDVTGGDRSAESRP